MKGCRIQGRTHATECLLGRKAAAQESEPAPIYWNLVISSQFRPAQIFLPPRDQFRQRKVFEANATLEYLVFTYKIQVVNAHPDGRRWLLDSLTWKRQDNSPIRLGQQDRWI